MNGPLQGDPQLQRDPSSFRDPEGYVFSDKGVLKRKIVTPDGLGRMRELLLSDVYQTQLVSRVIPTSWDGDDLVHERVPGVTYPYEWSFQMLKDAALTQLEILESCVHHNFILKDGSAFNSLFHKGQMVFVDLLSIDRYREGQVWEGYYQFCKHFLFPLLLESCRGIDFQSPWRGTADGIPLHVISSMLSWKDFFHNGVFKHVFLQNLLSRAQDKKTPSQNSPSPVTPATPTFSKSALLGFVSNLTSVVKNLQSKKSQSVWKNYAQDNTYQSEDRTQKESFIADMLTRNTFVQVVDLGCNTGHYSRFAAPFVERVVAVDFDPACIDILYRSLSQNDVWRQRITPMVGNLMNPSPALGWNLRERTDQLHRLKSDAFLALALIHHVCITENVPLPMFVAFLREIAPCGIVEWVDKTDPMVKVLLRNRRDVFETYTWEHFQRCLEEQFHLDRVVSLNQGNRKLCFVTKK